MLEQPFSASQAGPDARPSERPRSSTADLRRADDDELLAALRDGDLLALAECWHRGAPAAHAVARRLLGAPEDIESLLGELYDELWAGPPVRAPLERWARSRAFALGAARLRARGQAPSAPSCALLLTDLPAPRRPATDPVERIIAALPPEAATALVRAHDQGLPVAEQPDPEAPAALDVALEALARQTVDAEGAGGAFEGPLGDMVLGIADRELAATLRERMGAEPALAERVRFLRRGRRRLEGLPPAPELAPRVLLGVVARHGVGAPRAGDEQSSWQPGTMRTDEDVVITVARQAGEAGASRTVAAADEDTGPIAVIAPPTEPAYADGDLPPWPEELEVPAGWEGADPDAVSPAVTAAHAEPLAPRLRRGVGMLLIGTALGMLVGALTLVLR